MNWEVSQLWCNEIKIHAGEKQKGGKYLQSQEVLNDKMEKKREEEK